MGMGKFVHFTLTEGLESFVDTDLVKSIAQAAKKSEIGDGYTPLLGHVNVTTEFGMIQVKGSCKEIVALVEAAREEGKKNGR